MSDNTRAIMHDMIKEVKANNTGKRDKFTYKRNKIFIKTDHQDTAIIAAFDGHVSVSIPDRVAMSLFKPMPLKPIISQFHSIALDDGTKLALYKQSEFVWSYTVHHVDYATCKPQLLKLIALAQAEVLSTLADAKLLLECKHKK